MPISYYTNETNNYESHLDSSSGSELYFYSTPSIALFYGC